MPDKVEIEILPDGTIKSSTDPISMPNHLNAENFLKDMARLAGGTVDVKAKSKHAVGHTHSHGGVKHHH